MLHYFELKNREGWFQLFSDYIRFYPHLCGLFPPKSAAFTTHRHPNRWHGRKLRSASDAQAIWKVESCRWYWGRYRYERGSGVGGILWYLVWFLIGKKYRQDQAGLRVCPERNGWRLKKAHFTAQAWGFMTLVHLCVSMFQDNILDGKANPLQTSCVSVFSPFSLFFGESGVHMSSCGCYNLCRP